MTATEQPRVFSDTHLVTNALKNNNVVPAADIGGFNKLYWGLLWLLNSFSTFILPHSGTKQLALEPY